MPDQTFSLQTALDLAHAAKHAYDDKPTIRQRCLTEQGFTLCDVFTRNGSQVFIASDSERVLVSFRGTEAKLGQWLRNLQVVSVADSLGNVHSGFSAALEEIWPELRRSFDTHQLASKRVQITGHSLGAGMAAICAARLVVNDLGTNIESIYTFGQPHLAGDGFRATFDPIFRERYFRFINQADIVTRIPPGYDHVGTPKRITGDGGLENVFTGTMATLFPESDEAPGQVLESDTSTLNDEQFALLQSFIESIPDLERLHVNEPLTVELEQEGLFSFATDHFMDSYIQEIEALL